MAGGRRDDVGERRRKSRLTTALLRSRLSSLRIGRVATPSDTACSGSGSPSPNLTNLVSLALECRVDGDVMSRSRRRGEAFVVILVVRRAIAFFDDIQDSLSLFFGLHRAQLSLGRALVALARTLRARATGVVDDPVAALARLSDRLRNPAEALVERQVVADRVLYGHVCQCVA